MFNQFPPKQPVILLTPFTYENDLSECMIQTQETLCLNYWTSHLHAALSYYTIKGLNANTEWWLQGLQNEMVHKFFCLKLLFNYTINRLLQCQLLGTLLHWGYSLISTLSSMALLSVWMAQMAPNVSFPRRCMPKLTACPILRT